MNDSNLQQTLLNAAVNPPEGLWEKIVVALDEQKEDEPLRLQILAMEETAPDKVWHQIEPALNDHLLQHTILSVEETAPAFVWEAIDAELSVNVFDRQITGLLQQTEVAPPPSNWNTIEANLLFEAFDAKVAASLQDVEIAPPAANWNTIEQKLEQNEPAKIISINKSNTKIIRLAVAAAITGVLAWGGYRLLNTNSATINSAVVSNTASQNNSLTINGNSTSDSNSIVLNDEDAADTEIVRRAAIKERVKQKSALTDAVAFVETPDHNLQNTVAYQGIHHKAENAGTTTNGFAENQYYMVLNENGELVRVSKKINNLKCAIINGSTQVDAASALQSKECNEQIKKWREKMAFAAAISASAGDIDLNELVNSTEQQ